MAFKEVFNSLLLVVLCCSVLSMTQANEAGILDPKSATNPLSHVHNPFQPPQPPIKNPGWPSSEAAGAISAPENPIKPPQSPMPNQGSSTSIAAGASPEAGNPFQSQASQAGMTGWGAADPFSILLKPVQTQVNVAGFTGSANPMMSFQNPLQPPPNQGWPSSGAAGAPVPGNPFEIWTAEMLKKLTGSMPGSQQPKP